MLHWSVKLISCISKSPVTILMYQSVLQRCQHCKTLAKTMPHQQIALKKNLQMKAHFNKPISQADKLLNEATRNLC